MNTLTKEQLIKAMAAYYKESADEPDKFYEEPNPEQAAVNAVEYIFEIAAQQTQGA